MGVPHALCIFLHAALHVLAAASEGVSQHCLQAEQQQQQVWQQVWQQARKLRVFKLVQGAPQC
jgi:hypothetical protein